MRFSVYCLAFKTDKQNKSCKKILSIEETVIIWFTFKLDSSWQAFEQPSFVFINLPDMSPRSNRKPALGQGSTLIKNMTWTSYKLEPAIWSRGAGQRITRFNRRQLIITWCQISKKYKVNQVCMSQSTYLDDGRHLVRLHRRRRAYASTSNTASHDNREKFNSWVSFSFLYG